jgi:hypothetical protein
MIDVLTEKPVPLDEIYVEVPGRNGKPAHPITLERWGKVGVRGVRLETVMIGCRRCTTREALARFYQRVTNAADGKRPVAPSSTRTRREIAKAVRKAVDELQEAGA